MKITTVTVIGANGTMGSNVAGIFASFGNAKVYMVCRDIRDAEKAVYKASNSVKANVIEKRLIPKTYEDLEECICSSDLIFESVSENFEIKKNVYAEIAKYVQPKTIIGTGSSGLSINKLSECFDENIKENFVGIHMFNPPYNLTLCEVIPSKWTSEKVLNEIKEYLKNILHRTVVEVSDSPAFLGNRIGFQFINEAMQYAQNYKNKGGIDYIDSILGSFTGRSMPPLLTSDFVGLDVHKAIVDNLYYNTKDFAHETFIMPEFALKLISENKLGKKSDSGLYKNIVHTNGVYTVNVYDIETETYREKKEYTFPFVTNIITELRVGNYEEAFNQLTQDKTDEATICIELLIKYTIYGIKISRQIGENIYSADDVMANGFNWIPPLAVIDAFGGVSKFKKIAYEKLSQEYITKTNIEEVLENIPKSKYDFRPFFKAK